MTQAVIDPKAKQAKRAATSKRGVGTPASDTPRRQSKALTRRRSSTANPSPDSSSTPVSPALITQAQAFEELVRRANAGSETSLAGLREILDKNPAIWRAAGDVSVLAEKAWTGLLANGNRLAEEAIRRQLKTLKRELAGDHATPIEKVLVDLAGVAWLATNQAEIAAASPPGGSLQQARYRLRRAESAQRRFLSVVKTISLLRALVPKGLLPLATGAKSADNGG